MIYIQGKGAKNVAIQNDTLTNHSGNSQTLQFVDVLGDINQVGTAQNLSITGNEVVAENTKPTDFLAGRGFYAAGNGQAVITLLDDVTTTETIPQKVAIDLNGHAGLWLRQQ